MRHPDRAEWLPLAIVLALGTGLRALVMLASSGILWPDSSLYILSARSMLGPGHYHNHMKTPAYSAFLAVFMAFGETPAAGTLFIATQHLLGLLSTAVFYLIARRLFGRPVAVCSSLVFTAHPLLLYYETSVLAEILFVFVLSVLLLQSLRLLSEPTWRRAAVVGLLCGLATLTRPVAQAFIVFVVAIMIAAGFRDRWRQAVAAALLAAVTFGAVIAPWMFVNSRTYGFWGVSLGTGLGLFARVFMIDKMDPVPHTQYPKVKAALARARARGDGVHGVTRQLRTGTRDTDRAMFGLAFEAVRAHPREYARNSARNWRRLLLRERADPDICQGASGPYLCSSRALGRSTPMFPNVPPEGRPSLKEAIAAWFTAAYTPMWLVVPLAFAGIVLSLLSARIPKPHALLLLAAILYFTAVPALIQYPEERYRLPIDGLLFIFAAAAAVAAVAWLRAAAYRVGLQHPRLHR